MEEEEVVVVVFEVVEAMVTAVFLDFTPRPSFLCFVFDCTLFETLGRFEEEAEDLRILLDLLMLQKMKFFYLKRPKYVNKLQMLL